MAINPEIALSIAPLKIDNPLDNAGKALALKQAVLQNQGAEQSLNDTQKLRSLYAESGGDSNKLRSLLLGAGFGKEAFAADKDAQGIQQGAATLENTNRDIADKKSKMEVQLAGAFANLPPDQQATEYPNFVKAWNANGLSGPKGPGTIESEQWNPAFLPHLQAIAARGLSAEQQAEKGGYAQAGGIGGTPAAPALNQPAMPTTPQDVTDPTSGAVVRPLTLQQPEGTPIAQNAPPPPNVAPTVDVTAKGSPASPDELRAQAIEARKLGTKQGFQVAKDLEEAANKLDTRIQAEQRNEDVGKRFEARELRIRSATEGADLRPEDARFIAQEILAGNQTAGAGLARNQKAKAAVIRALTDEARIQGKTAQDAAAAVAEFSGIQAGQRTLGTREANLGVAIEELKQFIPIAQAASDRVPRSNFVPLNKLLQMGANQWSPEQAAFVAANRAVINSFSQIAARGGMNVHSIEAAEHAINTTQTPEQYKAVLKQFMTEAIAANKAPGAVRRQFSASVGDRDKGEAATPAEVPNTNAKGWTLHTDAKGNKAYVSPDGKQFEEVQ